MLQILVNKVTDWLWPKLPLSQCAPWLWLAKSQPTRASPSVHKCAQGCQQEAAELQFLSSRLLLNLIPTFWSQKSPDIPKRFNFHFQEKVTLAEAVHLTTKFQTTSQKCRIELYSRKLPRSGSHEHLLQSFKMINHYNDCYFLFTTHNAFTSLLAGAGSSIYDQLSNYV